MALTGKLGTRDSRLSNIKLGGLGAPPEPTDRPARDLPAFAAIGLHDTAASVVSNASAAVIQARSTQAVLISNVTEAAVESFSTDATAEPHDTLVEITNG